MVRRKLAGWIVILAMAFAAVSLAGCHTTLRDTQTIHNREATRIWIIRRNESGATHDQVVFCDTTLAQSGRPLCISWGAP